MPVNETVNTHMKLPKALLRRLPFLGAVGGGLLGFFDATYFSSIDLTATIGGRSHNLAVILGFTVTLALFGYVLGRLVVARAQAQEDRRTIAEQHDALARSQQALVQQEKLAALGRLVASIAHELRNPLGVIRSAAGILSEGTSAGQEPSQRLRRAAELVSEEVDHMNATITALLTFARPARLELEEVALDRVFDRACHLAEGRCDRGVEILRRPPDTAATVVGDFNLLTQLLAGLLDNAVEAARSVGGGRVEMRSTQLTEAISIDIADDGPGIPEDQRAHVFEPFYTTKDNGTGLGLALAHRIADAHGGRLEVVDGAGAGPQHRGACLRLRLPLAGGALP